MAALRQSPLSLHSNKPSPPPQRHASCGAKSSLKLHRLRPSPLSLSFRIAPSRLRRRSAAKMSDIAAASYSTALADVAISNGTLEPTLSDVESLSIALSNPSVLSFFTDPTILPSKKKLAISDIAAAANLQPHTANFLNIVVDKKRVDLFPEIAEEFEAYCNRLTGTEVALVSSVVKLEPQHLSQMARTVQRLTGAKNVRIKTAIDPSLIAGFTIRYGSSGSKLVDMSVKKKLDDIAAQLDFSISLAS